MNEIKKLYSKVPYVDPHHMDTLSLEQIEQYRRVLAEALKAFVGFVG